MVESQKGQLSQEQLEKLFVGIGLEPKTVQTTLKNKKLSQNLLEILQFGKVESLPKKKGLMIYDIASTLPESLSFRRDFFADYVLKDKIVNLNQFKHALTFLKAKGKTEISGKEFEEAAGVGVEVSEEAIKKIIDQIFEKEKDELVKQRYKAVQKVRKLVMDALPFGEGKTIIDLFNKKVNEVLGEETEEDKKAKVSAAIEAKKKKPEPKKEESKEANEQEEEEKPPRYDLTQLIARDIGTSLNTPELLEEHKKFTGGKIHTRFPPEPNGYLHIGHAKAMRFSFTTAAEHGGNCYLRMDDTNPEKENDEFINSIKDNVNWLGYKPWKMTHASDNFEKLYEFAVQLIKKDKAYVCQQGKEEMREDRRLKRSCPYRNRPIEESLRMFENMRMGLYSEQECCLKLKIDPAHPNPTMRDPVCYRIRYTSHPHAGDKWCIYPCYDFTHCVCDSLEHIDYSLCTLEFEIRRDLYYWVLENIGIYRPYQYEFSRLNISRNILSKRKLMVLVMEKYVNGWDDPRLLTINGMRRRGYTKDAINNFCDAVSVTRRGNEMMINFQFLEYCVRQDLNNIARRTLAVIEPVKLVLENVAEKEKIECKQPFFPQDKACKEFSTIELGRVCYVEKNDVREKDHAKFFGFAPGKVVGLKYAGVVKVKEVKMKENGEFDEIVAEFLGSAEKCQEKPKTFVHWVGAHEAIDCETRLYSSLFKVENVNELGNFLDGIDKNSLVVHNGSKINKNLIGNPVHSRFQFERIGYFIVDQDSDVKNKRYVFNRISTLVEKEKIKAMQDMK